MTGRLWQMSGVIVDLVYRVTAVPLPGQEAEVLGASIAAGGGFNAMVAARRAGMQVVFGGTVGTGPLADLTEAALVAEGIPRLRPRLPRCDQGSCVVLVDTAGERTFIAATGADGVVSAAGLAALRPAAEDWILLSGYGLSYPDSREGMSAWLRALPAGAKLVFDPSPALPLIPAPCLEAAMTTALWVSANAAEAALLTGQSDPAAAAEMLAAGRPAGGAVVRAGARGCWIAQAGQPARAITGHKVAAIDTNGAGDAHIGHFIAALSRGTDPKTAARLANVAAALSTTAEGPSTSPTLDRVLAALLPGPGNPDPT